MLPLAASATRSAPTQLEPFWALQLPIPAAHGPRGGGQRHIYHSPGSPPLPHGTALSQGFTVLDPQQSVPQPASFSLHGQGHSGMGHLGGSVPLGSCLKGVAKARQDSASVGTRNPQSWCNAPQCVPCLLV